MSNLPDRFKFGNNSSGNAGNSDKTNTDTVTTQLQNLNPRHIFTKENDDFDISLDTTTTLTHNDITIRTSGSTTRIRATTHERVGSILPKLIATTGEEVWNGYPTPGRYGESYRDYFSEHPTEARTSLDITLTSPHGAGPSASDSLTITPITISNSETTYYRFKESHSPGPGGKEILVESR